MWDRMRVSPQGREFQARLHGLEGERAHLDGIKNVLAARQGRKEVVDPGEQGIATELPGMPFALHTDGFSQMQAVLAGLARQNGGAAKAINDAGNSGERGGCVAARGCRSIPRRN